MTCSSVSASKQRGREINITAIKRNRRPLSTLWAGALVLALVPTTGCAKKVVLWHGTVKSGAVDIVRLAPQNPAWSNVVFYDRMIAAMPPITVGTDWSGPTSATLPAVPPLG